MDTQKKVKIIFDTDIGQDCDDAGALALIHRLCDKGEAELLAVTHCCSSPHLAGCIDSINTFYGRKVPIGLNYDREYNYENRYGKELALRFPHDYPVEKYKTPNYVEDTLTVIRKTLASAEDASITLVVTGTLASMEKLVESGADEISDLTGIELIQRKIKRTVVMGGRFFESWPMPIYADGCERGQLVTWEWNIKCSHLQTAQTVCEKWPNELVFSSYEIGSYIKTMVGYSQRAQKGDPVAYAYDYHNKGRGRCSWDHTAVLEAIRPNTYWNYHAFGKVQIDNELVTHWTADKTGKQTYLLPKVDYEEIRQVIDDLVDGK
ncbi:MAG: nucleoside hydrolase [Clostridia bacterium]|nr:nucleoside hydrolase [Clostridia bacterium]